MTQALSASIIDKCDNLTLRFGELMQVCVPDQIDIIRFVPNSVLQLLFFGSYFPAELTVHSAHRSIKNRFFRFLWDRLWLMWPMSVIMNSILLPVIPDNSGQ
jgi:hypothetical protein